MLGLGFGVLGLGFWVLGLGLRVWGLYRGIGNRPYVIMTRCLTG